MRPNVDVEWYSIKDLMTITGLGRTAVRVSKASYIEWTRRQRYMDVVADR
jgi:hypothetical protein